MPTSETRAPSAARLFATLAAPPSRTCSDWNWTTGTGASGEMRVTRPTMKRSSMTSPTTSTRRPANCAISSDARADVRSDSVTSGGAPRRSRRQRDEDQKEHLDFGVAEVVFEQSRCQQRDDCREAGGGEKTIRSGLVAAPQVPRHGDDEPEPARQRRQPALGGNLQRVVVQMRIDLVDRVGAPV